MRERARELVGQGDGLFAKRFPLESLWQTLCENFHVMRADYTRIRFFSEEFASFLMTGRPAMAHRDLTNALPAMMRPRDRQWLWARTHDEHINEDREARAYLDWISTQQFRIMYERHAGLVRACKEADGDFCSVGNAVLTVEPNQFLNGLLIRCWHPRDAVWTEGYDLQINSVHHKRKTAVRDLCKLFPKTVNPKITEALSKEPDREVLCRRIVIPSNEYDLEVRNRDRFPFVSIYIDTENDTIIEEKPLRTSPYVIPRWVTISGVQYAYSPAAVYGLPDARMLQQMALTMLEAGQKSVDPPLTAVAEAINGGVNTGAGMITYKDADYDERTGPVLEHLIQKYDGLQYGAAREERVEGTLDAIFFLNQIRIPQITKEMTAEEVRQNLQEFQRNSLPLLEPIETEYNGALSTATFETLQQLNLLGRPDDVPPILRGQEIRWEFDTPLKAAAEQEKIYKFSQVSDITAKGMQIDPTLAMETDWSKGYRDAVTAAGGAEWLLPEDKVKQMKAAAAQKAAAASAANQMAHGADTATKVAGAVESAGKAGKAMQDAGMM
jgi:Bacteriophage head to tail connecting protein